MRGSDLKLNTNVKKGSSYGIGRNFYLHFYLDMVDR